MAVSQESPETSSPQSLSLTAAQFAKLSPLSYLAAHLPSTRPSARSPAQARPPTLNTNSLTHAHGSAVVRVGDTAVVCGVRGEVLHLDDANAPALFQGGNIFDSRPGVKDADRIAGLDLLVPNIELSTGSSPQNLPGNPPSTLAQSLTQRVLTLLRISDLLPFEDLQIWARGPNGEKGTQLSPTESPPAEDDSMSTDQDVSEDAPLKPELKAFWTLYIDILVMSLDGSAFDTIWGAVLGAIRNTTLPDAWWDRDAEGVVCDPDFERGLRLQVRGCPVACSFVALDPSKRSVSMRTSEGQIHVLVDPDDFEESCCAQWITLVVDKEGKKLLRVEIQGGGLLEPEDLQKLTKRAGQRWEEWKFIFDSA